MFHILHEHFYTLRVFINIIGYRNAGLILLRNKLLHGNNLTLQQHLRENNLTLQQHPLENTPQTLTSTLFMAALGYQLHPPCLPRSKSLKCHPSRFTNLLMIA